ncbi:MAG: acyl-CoA dehydrogenase C-terminal domain-containing protein [Pseudomonadales bacterium]
MPGFNALERLGLFAQNELLDLTADGFKAAYSQFIERGWNAMPASPDFGGMGLPSLVSTPVLEMWKASNMAFSLCQMLTLGAVAAIAHHGSAQHKQRNLPKMVSGEWRAALVAKAKLTEPDAGFYRAKLITAHFYAEHVLPLAQAYREAIVNGAGSVLARDESRF